MRARNPLFSGRKPWSFVGVVAMAVVIGLASQVSLQADEKPTQAAVELSLYHLDALGQIQSLQVGSESQVRVLVFLTGECPVSKAYMPVLNALSDQWQMNASPVKLLGVWADSTMRPVEIAKFAKDYELRFPILLDRDGELARRLLPKHVPEAFVLDRESRVVYRGRIDDVYPELGQRKPEPTERTLYDAVAAALAGKPVAQAQTTAIGCYFEGNDTPPIAAKAATYSRDIAPILYANCVVCHREGEVAPFPLVTYQDAAKRARQLVRVTGDRLMPPWMPAQTHGEFVGQRTLSTRQLELIEGWAAAGHPEGDVADLPPLPQLPSGWRLGEPDLVLEMPEAFEIHADGPDIFQNFVIPLDLPTDKLVAAVDFRPGNKRVVHHTILYLDSTGKARSLDAAASEVGYSSFGGPGFLPTGSIGGWSPGNTPRRLPEGLGRYLKKGSDLVMQIHYHPTGKRETDRSKVGVYFVEKPKNVAAPIWVANYEIDIPPGDKAYTRVSRYTLPSDVKMVGVIPHMHLLGRSMRATATLPDGSVRQLVDVPKWIYNWQDEYHFAEPFKLPKGTQIEVEAVYDNSTDNPVNPSSPPQRVTYGEGTLDEMFYCFFLIAADEPKQLVPLIFDNLSTDGQRARLPGAATPLK